MKLNLIAASILTADFARLGEDTTKVINAGADFIHFDVMDGHYVSNITMGPMVLKALRNYGIKNPIDVHLMTNQVDLLIPMFAIAGANYITFHVETVKHIDYSLNLIKKNGCKAGLAFNPATPLNYLEYVINKVDLILLMSVNPGFSGQIFIPSTINKLRHARLLINKSNYKIILGVDGGISINNIANISHAGADMFVVGSSIFNESNYKSIIKIMRKNIS